jgi:hypothetical protein
MSCLPQSRGCERPFTDTFVDHLNRVDSTQYMHRAGLDVIERTVPQPEALYVDSQNGRKLVIERKTISWPSEYARRHNNDHTLAEIFSSELADLTAHDLYEICLPMLIDGKRADLRSLAKRLNRFVQTGLRFLRVRNWEITPAITGGGAFKRYPSGPERKMLLRRVASEFFRRDQVCLWMTTLTLLRYRKSCLLIFRRFIQLALRSLLLIRILGGSYCFIRMVIQS